MTTRFYLNTKTGETGEYCEEDAGYELKGVLYAYGDAIITGFKSKMKAEEAKKEWGYCPVCKGACLKPKCSVCGRKVD